MALRLHVALCGRHQSKRGDQAARLGAVEAVRSGTTAIVDNHYSPADLDTTLGVAGAMEEVGVRGVVARGMFGDMTEVASAHGLAESLFRYPAQEELDITRAAIAARPPGSQVGIWPAPINVIYNAPDLVREAISLAHDLGTGWHTPLLRGEGRSGHLPGGVRTVFGRSSGWPAKDCWAGAGPSPTPSGWTMPRSRRSDKAARASPTTPSVTSTLHRGCFAYAT